MSKRRILSIATLALSIIFSIASSYAQVTVMLHQPPPNKLNSEDLWNIDLTNKTGKTLNVQLRGTATEASKGQIFQGTSSVFELAPGFTKVSIPDISPLDVSYANEKYKEIVTRTGSVSAGDYQVCISVLDANSKEELGRGCIRQQVAHPTPPQLISPADGANVTEEHPIFTWMPPVPITKGRQLSYKLKIVEILDNQSPIDAMQSNPAWFEQKDIHTTSFQYPNSARKFNAGNYGWQVICFMDPNLASPIKSEVGSFVYQRSAGQITLVSPKDGGTVKEKEPVFKWMPPVPIPPGHQPSYELKIVEILDNQSPIDAMQSNPAWFEQKDIHTTSFQYPNSARKFKAGKNYGWQVICFMDPNLASPIKSEVWSFVFQKSAGKITLVSPKDVATTVVSMSSNVYVSIVNIPKSLMELQKGVVIGKIDFKVIDAIGDSSWKASISRFIKIRQQKDKWIVEYLNKEGKVKYKTNDVIVSMPGNTTNIKVGIFEFSFHKNEEHGEVSITFSPNVADLLRCGPFSLDPCIGGMPVE